jgi:hypothetical protein
MKGTIIMLSVVAFFALVVPIIYNLFAYVILPHKTLKEGFRDWVDESADDI